MTYNVGFTVFWLSMLLVFLTGIAIAMPVVQAKKGTIKHFGVKCIHIAAILVIACCFSVLYAFYGEDTLVFNPNTVTGGRVNFVDEILLPMFLIFAGYFVVLGIFFPERKYEKRLEERERKAQEEAQREREKREQNKKNNS